MKSITRILVYLKPYWNYAIFNIFFNLISSVFAISSIAMSIPFLGILFGTQKMISSVQPFEFSITSFLEHFNYYVSMSIKNNGQTQTLLYVSILIILLTLLKTGFKYLAMYNLAPIRNGVVRDIRNILYRKILILPLSYFSDERKGDIIARMTNDVQEIEWSIVSSLEMLFRDPLTILVYLIFLFIMSPQVTLFVLILLPISAFIIGQVGRNLRKMSRRGQKHMGIIMSIIEETLSGLRVVKAFNAEDMVGKKFEKENQTYNQIMIKMFRRRYLANPMSEFLGTIIMVVIMYYGANLVLGNKYDLLPQEFISYIGIFYMIIEPAKSLTSAWYGVQKGLASADRIDGILKAEVKILEIENPKPISEFKQSIEYRNVSFKYDKNYVLKNVNLKIDKGKTIALVGQSGSGKSTLADLLPRFHDVTEGEILIDGINIKEYRLSDLRRLMGNVNQEPILFNDSFYQNITFGRNNISNQQVIEAARVANAQDFIESSESQYDFNIGDRGGKLSGGQRQRVSIARAVLNNPPILILDEATSALDTESERLVQDALYNLMKNRTTLVIAHRLSTVQHADEICVLHEGEIVERGKHEDLLNLGGVYRKLHDLQMFSK